MSTLFETLAGQRALKIAGAIVAILAVLLIARTQRRAAPEHASDVVDGTPLREDELLHEASKLLADEHAEQALRLLQRDPRSWNEQRAVLTIRALCALDHVRAAKENLAMLRILAPKSPHIEALSTSCAGP